VRLRRLCVLLSVVALPLLAWALLPVVSTGADSASLQRRIDRDQFLLEKILDRFDVVIGLGLELFYRARVGDREIFIDAAEPLGVGRRQWRERVEFRMSGE